MVGKRYLRVVSVIIPNFNNEPYLSACLESVLIQGDVAEEVIVVDDHSTDDSLKVLESYARNHSGRIKLYKNPNKGAAAARNFGFQQSSGQYIQFLDADDLLGPGKIQTQLDCLQRVASGTIASCRWQHFSDQPKDLATDSFQPIDQSYDEPISWLLDSWMGKGMGQTGIWLTPRHLIQQAGPWDESLTKNQDGEFFCRVLLQASRIEFVPEAKVYYRKPTSANVSQRRSDEAAKSLLKSYQSYEFEALQREDSERVRRALVRNYQRFIYELAPQHPGLLEEAWNHINKLGPDLLDSSLGGKRFQQLVRIAGFKRALQLRNILKK
jgi:glycosyltransferase involved in cell wall biosynthesis